MGPVIGPAELRHQVPLIQLMGQRELKFLGGYRMIDPDLPFGIERITLLIPAIQEFLVDLLADFITGFIFKPSKIPYHLVILHSP